MLEKIVALYFTIQVRQHSLWSRIPLRSFGHVVSWNEHSGWSTNEAAIIPRWGTRSPASSARGIWGRRTRRHKPPSHRSSKHQMHYPHSLVFHDSNTKHQKIGRQLCNRKKDSFVSHYKEDHRITTPWGAALPWLHNDGWRSRAVVIAT